MALLFMEGFDAYADLAEVQDSDSSSGSTAGMSIVTGRTNGQALRMTSSSASALRNYFFDASTATFYMGLAMKMDSSWGSAKRWLWFFDKTGNEQVQCYIENDQIYVNVGGAELGRMTGTLPVGSWVSIVIKVYMHASAGTVEVWIDGVLDIDVSGVDTNDANPAEISMAQLFGNTNDCEYDDIYVGDDSGTDMIDEVGDCHIEMLLPVIDGNTNDFTAVGAGSTNADRVKEAPAADEDTTYNHGATATNKELYTVGSLLGAVDTVHAVQPQVRIRKEDAGNRSVVATVRSNATEVDTSDLGVGIAYGWRSGVSGGIYENDPDGGGAWDQAAVEAAEFGIEITV